MSKAVTLGFIDRRPQAASRAVASMAAEDAAVLLDSIPTRYGVLLLAHMSAWSVATILERTSRASAAAALAETDYQFSVSVMRLLPEGVRTNLLELLPKRLRGDFSTALSFPEDTVGAKMTTAFVALPATATVDDAITELRQIKRTKGGIVFVTDETREYCGAVSASELLQRSSLSQLEEVMDKNLAALSARARLSSVVSLSAWDDYSQLPVVNRQNLLIGALTRKTARAILRKRDERPSPAEPESILGSISDAFFGSMIGLAQMLTDVDPDRDRS